MQTKPLLGTLAALAVLLVVTWYALFRFDGVAPGALRPIAEWETVRDDFNAAGGMVRVIAVFSPTCAACQVRYTTLQDIMAAAPGGEWRLQVVWTPSRSGEDRAAALERVRGTVRPGWIHYWDPDGIAAGRFGKVLGWPEPAREVVLIYGRRQRFADALPPRPRTWMVVSPEDDPATRWDRGAFAAALDAALAR